MASTRGQVRPSLRIALLSLATAILLAGAAVAGLFGYLSLGW